MHNYSLKDVKDMNSRKMSTVISIYWCQDYYQVIIKSYCSFKNLSSGLLDFEKPRHKRKGKIELHKNYRRRTTQ